MSSSKLIYNVKQDQYAISTSGELASMYAFTCVIIIMIFKDNTVIVQHRADPSLCKDGKKDDAMELFHNMAAHIVKHKGEHCELRDVYFIGGTNTKLKETFQESLLDVKDEIIEEKDELLELEHGCILVSIAKAIKLVNVTWNMSQEKGSENGAAAPYVDVAVIRYKHDDYYLLVKQCINIVNSVTKIKASVCCGILSLKLTGTKSPACNEQVLLSNGEFCIKHEVVGAFQGKEDIEKLNELIDRFITICSSLSAKQVEPTSFADIDQNMTSRLSKQIPEAYVVVERLTTPASHT